GAGSGGSFGGVGSRAGLRTAAWKGGGVMRLGSFMVSGSAGFLLGSFSAMASTAGGQNRGRNKQNVHYPTSRRRIAVSYFFRALHLILIFVGVWCCHDRRPTQPAAESDYYGVVTGVASPRRPGRRRGGSAARPGGALSTSGISLPVGGAAGAGRGRRSVSRIRIALGARRFPAGGPGARALS